MGLLPADHPTRYTSTPGPNFTLTSPTSGDSSLDRSNLIEASAEANTADRSLRPCSLPTVFSRFRYATTAAPPRASRNTAAAAPTPAVHHPGGLITRPDPRPEQNKDEHHNQQKDERLHQRLPSLPRRCQRQPLAHGYYERGTTLFTSSSTPPPTAAATTSRPWPLFPVRENSRVELPWKDQPSQELTGCDGIANTTGGTAPVGCKIPDKLV